MFPLTQARKIPRVMLDHNPLIVDTEEKPEVKSKEFSFEKDWINHPEFLERVKKCMEFIPDNISFYKNKIKEVKDNLKGWGSNLKGKRRKYKLSLLGELEILELLEKRQYFNL
jgi:hypothetical protein